jgi:hypothetical protein
MRAAAAATFVLSSVVLSAAPAAVSSTQAVTVLVDFEKPHSALFIDALRNQLHALLGPVGFKVDLQLKSELPPYPEFAELVLFKMKGSCTMSALPLPIGALSDERGPLAMAYSSDGEVLHFGEVECDRVRESLQRILGRGNSEKHQAVFGTALGLVIAHEMYHMMANSSAHTKTGVTKSSLSARELLAGDLTLPALAQQAVHRGPILGR